MVHWWAETHDEVLRILESSLNGLDDEEAEKRLEKFGINEIAEREEERAIYTFLRQFLDPLIYILILSVLVLYYLNQFLEVWIVVLVILANAFIGFVQEWRAERAIQALKDLMVVKARVTRAGKVREIDSRFLVPGDVIYIEAGMRVPADARLISTRNLKVDESLLSGESEAVEKSPMPVSKNAILPERKCIIHAGTHVVEGNGIAVVFATGKNTELGKISRMVRAERETETPLIKRIRVLSKQLSAGVLAVSALNFILGYIRGYELSFTFLASVSLAVAVIPESLPALITMSLAFGVREMARRKAVIRRLQAVETLGSVTVICTDKTGTLTQNRMSVVSIHTPVDVYQVEGGRVVKNGLEIDPKTEEGLREIILAGFVCNKSQAVERGGSFEFIGDPTENAILEMAYRTGITSSHEIIDEIPFDSERKFMAVAAKINDRIVVYVKGSPEVIATMTAETLFSAEICASQGVRVIAFAKREIEDFDGFELENMEFLGFQCLMDPLRSDSRESVEKCREAGIKVVMITGDHPATALHIAEELGIGDEVITGWDMERMGLNDAIQKYSVFARVSPKQKLEIVRTFQESGEVVAVTGDGVNDSPALKRADIGVAMGSGSDVAKEAADMVTLDDSFSTIVSAVEEGRNVFRKIQRISSWTLPTNGGEGMIVLIAFLLAIQIPALPIHILWINTVTALLLGTMLVFEPIEKNLLRLKPTGGELVNRRIAFRIAYVSLLIVAVAYIAYFAGDGKRALAVNAIILCEAWYLLTPHLDRSFRETGFKNRAVPAGILFVIALQLVVTGTFLKDFLRLEPLTAEEWFIAALLSSVVFIAVELEKWLLKQRAGKP